MHHTKVKGSEEESKEEEKTSYLLPKDGKMLMINKVVHTKRTRSSTKVGWKNYNLNIDEGNGINVASTRMINRLSLPTIEHPSLKLYLGSKREVG